MALDGKKLLRQESIVRRLHPELREVELQVVPLHEAPLDEIAALIDAAWRHAYGNRIRIAFSPAFLRYCGGLAPEHGFALTARAEGALQGVALGLPLDISTCGEVREAVLTTGLCVSAAWLKRGLLELLMLRHGLALLDAGIPCSFHWRAAKGRETRDAGDTLAHAVSTALYAKALRLRLAARFGNLNTAMTLGLGALNLAHAVRGVLDRMPRGTHFRQIDTGNAEAVVTLLNDASRGQSLSLVRTAERLVWDCSFDDDGIRGRGWVLLRGPQALAAAWGYTNPVSATESYFSMDRVVFADALDVQARRAFLARVEGAIRREFTCFSVLMPGCVCDDPPERLGYRPVKTYYVGATETGFMPELAPEALSGLPLPLR